MKRKLLQLLGILMVLGALVYVAQPVGHIPPYDANLVRLAESPLQGYCAGVVFWKSQGVEDTNAVRECRADNDNTISDEPDMFKVEAQFCRAIIEAGWEGAVRDCLDIMAANQYWPTYGGSITNAWNRARPYPRSAIQGPASVPDSSRTGGRDEVERNL